MICVSNVFSLQTSTVGLRQAIDALHYDNVRLLQLPRFVHNMHLLKLIDTL
jgi:hypothetical protein